MKLGALSGAIPVIVAPVVAVFFGLAPHQAWRFPHALDAVVASSPAQVSDTTFSPDVIALGEKIFQGRAAGGQCFLCHLPNAHGQPGIAPNLTDAAWIHGDGSYAFIVRTIETGVPRPKEAAAPMPPKGGANLTDDQVKAVAAYVYSLRKQK